MKKFAFVTRIPDHPGALHKAAEIAKRYDANIHRIHYNRKIDPNTVFFEITTSEDSYKEIKDDLQEIGYLQTSLEPPSFLKFNVYLPHRTGALFEFLNYLTSAKANIGFIDFDDTGIHPERLSVSLNLDETQAVDELLNQLKSIYRLEITEYNEKHDKLDDTVFYIYFAQKLRSIIGDAEDEFLIKLLSDVNHIVQELMKMGEDPKQVFQSILLTGKTLKDTTGDKFYADVQKITLKDLELFCFQPPCGGNIFILNTPQEMVMMDTGYGIYYQDVLRMLQKYGLGDLGRLKSIYITHADADHSGAGGFFEIESFLHEGTLEIIKKANRAYGSSAESFILEELYTNLINLFSKFNSPKKFRVFPDEIKGMRNIFPVICSFKVGYVEFEVLEGLGGHLHGHVFFLCPDEGFLFSGDSLINFESLDEHRRNFNILAKNLMTSVNVDSEAAQKEREGLIKLATEMDEKLSSKKKRCLICGGHGAVSVLSGAELETYGKIERYKPN